MRIKWKLDEEEIALEELVGDISIAHGEAVISEPGTYIDSWLEALALGLEGIRDGKRLSVEIVEEPDPLIFDPQEGGVRLSYQNASIFVESIDEFSRCLQEAIEGFLSQLNKIEKLDSHELLNLTHRLKR